VGADPKVPVELFVVPAAAPVPALEKVRERKADASADSLSEVGATTMTRHVTTRSETGAITPRPIAVSARQKDRFSAIGEKSRRVKNSYKLRKIRQDTLLFNTLTMDQTSVSYLVIVTVTVVLIAGYLDHLATDNFTRHEPGVFGATRRPDRITHFPDTFCHLRIPFDGVVIIDVKNGDFFTL
jgi:hypothetical protein